MYSLAFIYAKPLVLSIKRYSLTHSHSGGREEATRKSAGGIIISHGCLCFYRPSANIRLRAKTRTSLFSRWQRRRRRSERAHARVHNELIIRSRVLCVASGYADKKFPTLPLPENYANSAALCVCFFFHYFICALTHFDPGGARRGAPFIISFFPAPVRAFRPRAKWLASF